MSIGTLARINQDEEDKEFSSSFTKHLYPVDLHYADIADLSQHERLGCAHLAGYSAVILLY